MSAAFYAALRSRIAPRSIPSFSDRRQETYDDAYFAVLEGKDCEFYPTNEWRTARDSPEWDDEQQVRLFNAIKLAASLVGATDAERYAVIENALRADAEKFAEWKAGQV